MNSLVVLGIALSLGLMVLSALVVFRVNFRRADTDLDGWIYGLGMGSADLLKALLPFIMAWGWKARSYGAVAAAALLFGVVTIAALQAELEFAAEHWMSRKDSRIEAVERRTFLRNAIEAEGKRIQTLAGQRSSAEVDAAIRAVLARNVDGGTVGSISRDCTMNRRVTRPGCEEVATLQAEVERAREFETRTQRRTQLIAELQQLGTKGVGSDDPQLDLVTGILRWFGLGWDRQDVRQGLLLLVGLVLELSSGLGLFLVTTPWRVQLAPPNTAGRGGAGEKPAPALVDQPPARDGEGSDTEAMTLQRIAAVEEFALERVRPNAGGKVTGDEIFLDYRAWCLRRHDVPLARPQFATAFEDLAHDVGIPRVGTGITATYLDLMLGDETGTTATIS